MYRPEIDRCLKVKGQHNEATEERRRKYYTYENKIQNKISLNEKRYMIKRMKTR